MLETYTDFMIFEVKDFNEWAKLRKLWISIVSKSVSKLSIYHFKNPDSFYELCRLISYIRDHKINKNLNADM